MKKAPVPRLGASVFATNVFRPAGGHICCEEEQPRSHLYVGESPPQLRSSIVPSLGFILLARAVLCALIGTCPYSTDERDGWECAGTRGSCAGSGLTTTSPNPVVLFELSGTWKHSGNLSLCNSFSIWGITLSAPTVNAMPALQRGAGGKRKWKSREKAVLLNAIQKALAEDQKVSFFFFAAMILPDTVPWRFLQFT